VIETIAFFTGLLHGVDPSKGWLFALYLYLHRKSLRYPALAFSFAWLGHAAAIYASLPVAFAYPQALPAALLAAGLLGLRHREFLKPWSGVEKALLSSYLFGFLHGTGFALVAICGAGAATMAVFHMVGMALGGLAMFAAAAAVGTRLVKKVWINYDLVWSSILFATAAVYLAKLI